MEQFSDNLHFLQIFPRPNFGLRNFGEGLARKKIWRARRPEVFVTGWRLQGSGTEGSEVLAMTTFSAEDLAAFLHPRELELLEEIAEELEDLEAELPAADSAEAEKNAGSTFVTKGGHRAGSFSRFLLEATRSAQADGPVVFDPVFRKPKKDEGKKSLGRLSPLERERFDELGDELEDIEKQGRRLPAVPTQDEISLLLDTVEASTFSKKQRDYLIIRVAYATGCRRSELEGLLVADLDLKGRRVFIRDGKWSRDRYVLLDEETTKRLDDFTYGLAPSDKVFGIGDRQIGRRILHWGEVSGLSARYQAQGRHFSSHSLRHAFATHLHEGGVSIYNLQDLMGHRFNTTTRLYIHTSVGRMLDDYDTSHPLALRSKKQYDRG